MMTKQEEAALRKAARLALNVLYGCVPSANYTGQRRHRQFERIEETKYALTVALGIGTPVVEEEKPK